MMTPYALYGLMEAEKAGYEIGNDKAIDRGMGLQGMRERAEQQGGVFSVDSTPSEGTRVRVRIGTVGNA